MDTQTQRDAWIREALRYDAQLVDRSEHPTTGQGSQGETEPGSKDGIIPDEHWYPDPTLEPTQQRWISPPRQRRTVKPLVEAKDLVALVALGFVTGLTLSWLAGSALMAVISAA